MNEQDAYEYIRKISCTKNISMRRVADDHPPAPGNVQTQHLRTMQHERD